MKINEQKANFKAYALRAGNFARYNAPYLVVGGVAAGSLASAEEFSFDYAGIATKVTATIIAAATAGAGVKALGISVKAAFRWAGSLMKG